MPADPSYPPPGNPVITQVKPNDPWHLPTVQPSRGGAVRQQPTPTAGEKAVRRMIGTHFISPDAARWLQKPTSIGGAGRRVGQLAPMAATGRGHLDGKPRPSLLLQLEMQEITEITPFHKAEHEALFVAWLNATLRGAMFSIGIPEAKEELEEVKDQITDLEGAISKVFEEGAGGGEAAEIAKLSADDPEKVGEAVGELFKEIGGVFKDSITDLKDVKAAAESVTSSIPMLGTITAGVKLIFKGIQLGLLVHEAYKIYKAEGNSFSLIERETLGSILAFQKKEAANIGKDMATTAATGAGAAFGAGAAVDVGVKLVDLLMNIVMKIIHLLEIRKANAALKTGSLTLEQLRTLPTLGLHLPHLEGVDTLTLLGVLPPGWRVSSKAQQIRDKLNEIIIGKRGATVRSTDKGWLTSALKWDDPKSIYQPPDDSGLGGSASAAAAAATKEYNPWYPEYTRIVYMLEKTDKYLNTQNWKLYKGSTLLHDPATTGFIERAKEKVKERLKSTFTEVLSPTSPTSLPPIGGKKG